MTVQKNSQFLTWYLTYRRPRRITYTLKKPNFLSKKKQVFQLSMKFCWLCDRRLCPKSHIFSSCIWNEVIHRTSSRYMFYFCWLFGILMFFSMKYTEICWFSKNGEGHLKSSFFLYSKSYRKFSFFTQKVCFFFTYKYAKKVIGNFDRSRFLPYL